MQSQTMRAICFLLKAPECLRLMLVGATHTWREGYKGKCETRNAALLAQLLLQRWHGQGGGGGHVLQKGLVAAPASIPCQCAPGICSTCAKQHRTARCPCQGCLAGQKRCHRATTKAVAFSGSSGWREGEEKML